MRTATIPVLQNTYQKTEEWINDVMNLLDWDDPRRAYKALRVVLHTLRDRLSVEEATDLAAQLPMLVKGIFYDGWNPTGKPIRVRTAKEFVNLVNADFPDMEKSEYIDAEDITRAVFKVISGHVSEGEIKDIAFSMPEDLRGLWD